jgi:methionine-rich copper-binding protein CopC
MQSYMKSSRLSTSLFLCASLAVAFLFAMPHAAFAHALLQTSNPAANATVHPGVVPVLLTYNSRVDAAHSSLSLVLAGKAQPLAIDVKAPANVLRTQTPPLKAGHYELRWQVVASDGHISRGQFSFDVK